MTKSFLQNCYLLHDLHSFEITFYNLMNFDNFTILIYDLFDDFHQILEKRF